MANWNGAPYLERCLTALRAQTHPLQQIVVVDNGSTDGSN
ncbi:MAG TPA: glycosyltransferase family 2 protein, partial [Candidatus Latescibacteria bacterium]|nr:glycosyltransferase family 2 protein [Candidatus Latescibacterota bacterium]